MTKRDGLSLAQFFERFPTDAAAEAWFVERRWPDGPMCPRCDSSNVATIANRKPMPYRCWSCRKHFSVTVGTIMQSIKLGLRTWLLAIYLLATDAKGRSSTKLGRDLDVQQRTAWALAHKIRAAMAAADNAGDTFAGPVEIDELYVGGKQRNRHMRKREHIGGGAVGKAPVIGIVDRPTNLVAAMPVQRVTTTAATGAVKGRVAAGGVVYSDGSRVYQWLGQLGYQHVAVDHTAGEYVRGPAHVNSVESFGALFRRGYYGTHHWMSAKHLHRYVGEFASRQNLRPLATTDRMALIAGRMEGLGGSCR